MTAVKRLSGTVKQIFLISALLMFPVRDTYMTWHSAQFWSATSKTACVLTKLSVRALSLSFHRSSQERALWHIHWQPFSLLFDSSAGFLWVNFCFFLYCCHRVSLSFCLLKHQSLGYRNSLPSQWTNALAGQQPQGILEQPLSSASGQGSIGRASCMTGSAGGSTTIRDLLINQSCREAASGELTFREKRKQNFTFFSNHNGSLLRRQPGVLPSELSGVK